MFLTPLGVHQFVLFVSLFVFIYVCLLCCFGCLSCFSPIWCLLFCVVCCIVRITSGGSLHVCVAVRYCRSCLLITGNVHYNVSSCSNTVFVTGLLYVHTYICM